MLNMVFELRKHFTILLAVRQMAHNFEIKKIEKQNRIDDLHDKGCFHIRFRYLLYVY